MEELRARYMSRDDLEMKREKKTVEKKENLFLLLPVTMKKKEKKRREDIFFVSQIDFCVIFGQHRDFFDM